VFDPSCFGNGGSESKSASFAPNFANNGLMTNRCVTQARVPSMNPIKACVRMNTRTLCNVLICQSESIGSKRAPAKITHDGIALFGTHGHFFNANPSARQNTKTRPHFGMPPRLFKNSKILSRSMVTGLIPPKLASSYTCYSSL